MPLFLPPVQLGVWNVYTTLMGYGANAHMGLQHGVSQLVPLLDSELRGKKAKSIINTAHSGILALSIFVSLGIFFYLIYEEYEFLHSILVGIYIVLQSLTQFHILLARSTSRFDIYSISISLSAFLSTSMIITALYFFRSDVAFALAGSCLAQLILLLYLSLSKRYAICIEFNKDWFYKLFKYGRILMILGVLDMMMLTMDRWLVVSNFGTDALGIYAFAMFFIVFIGAIPAAASQVMYPMLVKAGGSKLAHDQMSIEYTIPIVSMLANLIAVAVYFLSPYLIINFYPKYLDAINIIKVMILGGVLCALNFIPGTSAVAGRRIYGLIKIQILSLISAFFAAQVLIQFGWELIAVAISYDILFFFCGLGYLYLEINFIKKNNISAAFFCARIMVPIFIIYFAISFLAVGASYDLLSSILTMSAMWVLVILIHFLVNSKNPVFLQLKFLLLKSFK